MPIHYWKHPHRKYIGAPSRKHKHWRTKSFKKVKGTTSKDVTFKTSGFPVKNYGGRGNYYEMKVAFRGTLGFGNTSSVIAVSVKDHITVLEPMSRQFQQMKFKDMAVTFLSVTAGGSNGTASVVGAPFRGAKAIGIGITPNDVLTMENSATKVVTPTTPAKFWCAHPVYELYGVTDTGEPDRPLLPDKLPVVQSGWVGCNSSDVEYHGVCVACPLGSSVSMEYILEFTACFRRRQLAQTKVETSKRIVAVAPGIYQLESDPNLSTIGPISDPETTTVSEDIDQETNGHHVAQVLEAREM